MCFQLTVSKKIFVRYFYKHVHLLITIGGGPLVPENTRAYVQQPGTYSALLHFSRTGKYIGGRLEGRVEKISSDLGLATSAL